MHSLIAVGVIIILIIIILTINVNRANTTPTNKSSTINIDQMELVEVFRKRCIYKTLDDNTAKNVTISSNYYQQGELGLYNMSVRKNKEGFSGVIRGCTWNGCCNTNSYPAFSYPYYISITDDGVIKDLFRIELNYDNFNKCTQGLGDIYANGVEDPRIFTFREEEWVIGNSLGLSTQKYPCINTMCLFKVLDPINSFKLLLPPSHVNNKQRQKNWSPFEHNGELYCEYSIQPHIIIKVDIKSGLTTEIYKTGENCQEITSDNSLKGGTPPIIINNSNSFPNLPDKFYLSIGHTRNFGQYLHFFYAFEINPPFSILQISDLFKLDGSERIQFASGISAEENMIYVSYGVDDCSNKISRFNFDDVFEMLKK